MKNSLFALCALLSINSIAQAKYELWFDNDNLLGSFFEPFGNRVSKEDQEALNKAAENLDKISYEIKQDDQKTTITFTGFGALDKKDVKVIKQKDASFEDGWVGTITTKDGIFEFFISRTGLTVTRKVEIKKEIKYSQQEKVHEKTLVSHAQSEGKSFKKPINLNSIKAEPLNTNALTITVDNEKEEVLLIP